MRPPCAAWQNRALNSGGSAITALASGAPARPPLSNVSVQEPAPPPATFGEQFSRVTTLLSGRCAYRKVRTLSGAGALARR